MASDTDRAAVAAVRGLAAAVARHSHDRTQADHEVAFASLVECTWWVASLDLRIFEGPRGAEYARQREADPDGRHVIAMIWARDRHYHQLPFTLEEDATPFLGGASGRGGPPFFISPGLIWRPRSELPSGGRRSPEQSPERYDELLAGRKTSSAAYHCLSWFERIAGPPHDFLPRLGDTD